MTNDDVSVEDENTDITNEYNIIKSNFQSLADKTWHELMHSEIKLFECIEIANLDFKQVIDALLNEFIEYAQAIFVQMRNAEINFSGAMHETVARYITMKAVVAEEATVAAELQEVSSSKKKIVKIVNGFHVNLQCFEDKSNIGKFILGSREHHILVIDTREERLISRGRSWVNELIAKMQR